MPVLRTTCAEYQYRFVVDLIKRHLRVPEGNGESSHGLFRDLVGGVPVVHAGEDAGHAGGVEDEAARAARPQSAPLLHHPAAQQHTVKVYLKQNRNQHFINIHSIEKPQCAVLDIV